MQKFTTAVVIPNWNGRDTIGATLDSLMHQSVKTQIIVVDNGSVDDSVAFIKRHYPSAVLVEHDTNKGFAGGVNSGIKKARELGITYTALLNNDATADEHWLRYLVQALEQNQEVGIAACKFVDSNNKHFDSTGDLYTVWGLPFPRGRGEPVSDVYDKDTVIFGASGGASLYRMSMLKEIGLFDEAFFAYYEDVDLSFRAQLAGWQVCFVPAAIAYHQIGATSSKIKGFTTYQTLKNLPMIVRKNVPLRLLPRVLPRFFIAYHAIFWSAIMRGQLWPALNGWLHAFYYLPKDIRDHINIQRKRRVTSTYIWSIMTHDLPPNATKLRNMRGKWWHIIGRKS